MHWNSIERRNRLQFSQFAQIQSVQCTSNSNCVSSPAPKQQSFFFPVLWISYVTLRHSHNVWNPCHVSAIHSTTSILPPFLSVKIRLLILFIAWHILIYTESVLLIHIYTYTDPKTKFTKKNNPSLYQRDPSSLVYISPKIHSFIKSQFLSDCIFLKFKWV